jgi:hypothetical protein
LQQRASVRIDDFRNARGIVVRIYSRGATTLAGFDGGSCSIIKPPSAKGDLERTQILAEFLSAGITRTGRTSFAPETAAPTNDIELKRKRSKINEGSRYPAAHNGPVAGSSPAGPTIWLFGL